MALEEGKESSFTAGTSSGAVSSEKRTPKLWKAKSEIVKKAVVNTAASTSELKNTTVQGRKRILKKKVIAERKGTDNMKGDIREANRKDVENKNALSGEQGIVNHGKRKKKVIVVRKKIKKRSEEGFKALYEEEPDSVTSADKSKKRPEIGKDEVERREKKLENIDGSRNKRLKQNGEGRNGSSNKQDDQKNKEKFVGNEKRIKKEGKKHQLDGEWKEQRNHKVGGLILFCNSKTKLDCFRYHIMGVSSSRKNLVMDIKPGLKLFLYDFDIKLLYGIYSASSPGGMKLESAAFNGSFPFQVRFEIYKDCYPLPESVFKRAIKENYSGYNKFDQELTPLQVNKLMELFKPADVNEHALPLYPPQAIGVDIREAKEKEGEYLVHHRRDPLAREPYTYNEGSGYDLPLDVRGVDKGEVKEKKAEYLARHHREPLAREPYTFDEVSGYDLHLNKIDDHLSYRPAPSSQRREPSLEQNFLSEKDYRMYGLRRERRNVSPPRTHITSTLGYDSRIQEPLLMLPNRDAEKEYHIPYIHSSVAQISASTASIVDSYLKVPYYGLSDDPYKLPLRAEREEVALGSYSHGRRETTYQPESTYLLRREIHPSQRDYMTEASQGREKDNPSALYPSYAFQALSERAKPETSLAPVSARYSFAGPSRQYL